MVDKKSLAVELYGVDGIFSNMMAVTVQPIFSLKDDAHCYCQSGNPDFCLVGSVQHVPQGEPSPYSWLGG